MDFLINSSYWLIAAIVLIIAEIFLPGGIVIFLGCGCLVVATAIWFGLVSSWVGALTLFFISSMLFIVVLREFAMRYFGGDFSKDNTIEILDEVGEEVKVVETIGPGNAVGRIDLRGTQWPAVGDGGEIATGEIARIVSRENVQYIVEGVPGNTADSSTNNEQGA